MKKLKLILIVAILVYVISIVAIYFEAKKKRNQKNTKDSLQEGFGSYGDEESLGCFSSDGKCSTQGIETTVQYCRPHPNTGRGCIDRDGKQSYATIIKKRPCQTQCAASKFTVESGVRISNPENTYLGTSTSPTITSAGCDKIIDKRFGLDLTSNFLGKFNADEYKYPLKSCIPSGKDSIFQGYYQRVSTCLQSDGKGQNNCRIVCGRDRNILNLNGFANAKLNKNLLSYFPTETNEEGDIRNVCYDINNKDQIEVLNYPGNVPVDFIYPNKCYKHTNVLNFNENIWPTSGTSNIFSLSQIQVSEDVSYIDLKGEQISRFETYVSGPGDNTIITENYDLNNNQDSYVKVRVGSNIALLEKIYDKSTTGIHATKSTNTYNIETDTYYVYCDNFDSVTDNIPALLSYLEKVPNPSFITSDFFLFNTNTNIFGKTGYFNPNTNAYKEKYFFQDGSGAVVFPCSIKEFFDPVSLTIGTSNSFITRTGTSTLISVPNLSSGSSFFYMVVNDQTNQINQHVFAQGSITDNIISINNTSLFDTYDDIELVKLYVSNSKMNSFNSVNPKIRFTGSGGHFNFNIDFEQSFLTGTTFINKFTTKKAKYNYLNIRKNFYDLPGATPVGSDVPYCVFATTPHNNVKGYHYPLYLTRQKPSDIQLAFMEFPGVEFNTPYGTSLSGQRSNYYFRPSHFQDKELKFFNEEILTSTVTYTNNYIKIFGNKKYFLSDLETINSGENYVQNNLYRLSSRDFSNGYNLDVTGISNIDLINNSVTNGTSLSVAVVYNKNVSPEVKTVKIIRGDSAFVSGGVGTILNNNNNENKVKDYFSMIQFQGFVTDSNVNIIFEPERHLSLAADFDVFKSPYTLGANNQKNFICYDETGRARPEGYIQTINTNGSKVYTNLACPSKTVNYEVLSDQGALCAIKGVENTLNQDKLKICKQDRDSKVINFINSSEQCIISPDLSEYKTLNNQLGFGLQLFPIQKALTLSGLSQNTGSDIENTLNAYSSYFTKEYEENKLYGPTEEFYIEKTRNNFFVSLTNDNINFVDNVASWRRVFTFENNDPVSTFQYFFNVHPADYIPNKINLGLGKFSNTFEGLTTNVGSDINISFQTVTPGVNSQNYLNQGVTYFWGGSRRRTDYGAENKDKDGETIKNAFYTDYIKQLETSTYRVGYNSKFLDTTGLTGVSVNPNYISMKFQVDPETAPITYPLELLPQSPIYCTFGMDQLKDITFSSIFFDDNLTIPWANNVKAGDIFNPDFTYFNTFIYTFLLTNGENNITPGTSLNTLLQQNFLYDSDSNGALFNQFTDSLTFGTSSDYNAPEISDYILVIPETFGELKGVNTLSDGKPFEYVYNPDFSQFYPTASIRRIKKINDTSNDKEKIIEFDDKEYSGAKSFNTSKGKNYLFNLGKGQAKNNIITRSFDILRISETQVKTEEGNFYFPPDSVEFIIAIFFGPPPPNVKIYYTVKYKQWSADGTIINKSLSIPVNSSGDVPIDDWVYSDTLQVFDSRNSPVKLSEQNPPNLIKNSTDPFTQKEAAGAQDFVVKTGIEFNFTIESIPQTLMNTLFENYQSTKNIAFAPNQIFKPNSTTNGTSCVDNKAYSKAEWKATYPDGYSGTDTAAKYVPCFSSGCMPGDPEKIKGGGHFAHTASCAQFLEDPGHTDLGCPGGKFWRCIQTQASLDAANLKKAKLEDLNNGGNFLTPALSARYIKSSFKSPQKKLTGNNSYATLYNSSPEDSLNIKVISQSTEIAYNLEGDKKSFYINEFREDQNYFVKQVDRVFSKGDTFDYYFSSSSTSEIVSGNKKFYNIATFRVDKVGITIRNPENQDYRLDFDYKCSLVTSIGKITPEKLYDTYFKENQPQINYNNLYASYISTDKSYWRYTLPYTITDQAASGGQAERVYISGYKGIDDFYFNQSSFINGIYGKQFNSIHNGTFFLDTYKINNYTDKVVLNTEDPFASAIYSGAAIRAGILDTMVLTGTQLESELGQKAYVNVKVTGKPYGVGFLPSCPNTRETMINYNAFGTIEDFNFNNNSVTFPINTILTSNKGFKIKFLSAPPPIYSFQNVESPSGKILQFQKDFNYAESEIVNVKNRNLKQYFRNISGVTIPYMNNIDIDNPYIPFAIYKKSTNTWFYPVFKFNITGTTKLIVDGVTVWQKPKLFQLKGKLNTSKYMSYTSSRTVIKNALSRFKKISETVYPENNFVIYDQGSYYGVGDIVKSEDGKLYRSLVSVNNADLLDATAWEVDDLTQQMSSPGDNFYSTFKQDDNFIDIINNVKNLDNQNYPALIKYNFDKQGSLVGGSDSKDEKENEYEFCPKPCTYYDLKEDYSDTFINTSYFDSIRYLFETPTMITKSGTSLFLSLGNAPVAKNKNYNTGFLQDGGAKSDFLSQYLYFINIKDQEEKYNRPLCTGGLCVTTSTGFQQTDANKFEFANSLLFNFLPCGLDDQDFIKYSVDVGMSSGTSFMVTSLPQYPSSSTPNIFPPHGVGCSVLISSKNGTCFTPSFGHFEYSYNIENFSTAETLTLTNGTCFVTVSGIQQTNFIQLGPDTVPGHNFGDIWYMDSEDLTKPFGFLIPDTLNEVRTQSFIQLNNSSVYKSGQKINFIPEKTAVGPGVVSLVTNNFDISLPDTNPGTESGTYTDVSDPQTKFTIEFKDNKPLQRTSAIFHGDVSVSDAEDIYLPTYDITKNIKAQAITVFGESFTGELGYTLDSKNANYALDGEKKSTMIFNEFRNNIFLTDDDKKKKEVFVGDKTVNLDNVYKTFLINFDPGNSTFTIKPNLFRNPITNPTNKFLYNGGTSSVKPESSLAAINTESTTVLISEEMTGLQGVSVNISLEDFVEYKTSYNSNGSSIPGKTNVQIQLSEIRENRTTDYIEKDNKCSIYFEPIVGVPPPKYVEATWNMKMASGLNAYNKKTALRGKRFNQGRFFKNATEVVFAKNPPRNPEPINVYLGCNLSYNFDQTDSSNDTPVVFSQTQFVSGDANVKTSTFTIDDKRIFSIKYLINNETVTYKDYSEKFSASDTTKRSVQISFQSSFDLDASDFTVNNSSIFYGPNNSNGSEAGGKIMFVYH